MSSVGIPSVMQTTSGKRASTASRIASAANGGGTKITEAFAPVLAHRLRDCVEYWNAEMFCAAFARRHAADYLRAVFDHLLGVKGAFAAGEALDDDARLFID